MSSYANGEWVHAQPTCPTCCAVRARQGFEMPAVLGEDCEECKMVKEALVYYASDAFKQDVEQRLREASGWADTLVGDAIMDVGGVLLPAYGGLPPTVAVPRDPREGAQ